VQEGVAQAIQRLSAVNTAAETEDDDSAIEALDAEKAALERFIVRGKKTADFVQSVKLNQTIIGVCTGKNADAQVGMYQQSDVSSYRKCLCQYLHQWKEQIRCEFRIRCSKS